MTKLIQAIRGMNDILPSDSYKFKYLENKFAEVATQYGYSEIRFPYLENTKLFKRTIGEVTDIVEKEMYTFTDLNGESISLRPEGTAGCVRACLEHGLLRTSQKLWYMGPMFRHEKPQKGRYRQFNQFGLEVFGQSGVFIELEIIQLTFRLWEALGIAKDVKLQINSIGSLACRQKYKEKLVKYLTANSNKLDEDSHKRLHKNPLRILDSKNKDMQALLKDAPKLRDSLSPESLKHFNELCRGLEKLNIDHTINDTLVRGLDYYSDTVFEWVTDKLGSQAAICAGGRYDKLVEQLGGSDTPAVGFAIGIERLLLLTEELNSIDYENNLADCYIVCVGEDAIIKALNLGDKIREHFANLQVIVNTDNKSFKSQFKKADKSDAKLALIIGEGEVVDNKVSIKFLQKEHPQVTVSDNELIEYLSKYLERS